MNTYRVTCQELGEFVVELQAHSIEEARELVTDDVDKYKVIDERTHEITVETVIEVGLQLFKKLN